MTALHLIQRRYLAENLVRRRRADEHRRHVASQRSAHIDPNPHQIDAVMFALARLPEGGCILADEVGLGKTIEAGLVIAQVLAEGGRRIIVVTPKALLGQWKQELYTLFSIDAQEVTRKSLNFSDDGVFLATRDLVGSEAGSAAMIAAGRFDLCVIDEAHEIFAAIYKRFDRDGSNRENSPHARMADRLASTLHDKGTPILLLTATPIQNSLPEIWGLIHYIDPTGTLLGDLPTFRDLFCPSDPRVLMIGQEHELQRRLSTVVKRTLRRQAQEFMREPFVDRQARTFEYWMSPEERALYDDITHYLLEEDLHAFRGNQRALLLLGFHRRMASSLRALSVSLERVAQRLRAMCSGATVDDAEMLADLEDDETVAIAQSEPAPRDAGGISAELARVESFIARAQALPTDSKARALLSAIRLVKDQAEQDRSSGKVVIFTEALTTQDYLRDLLLESGLVSDAGITTFRGSNDSKRAMEALDRWQAEVGAKLDGAPPSPDIAIRLALVHEFKTRSLVFISTEAGAKGLNLQFCDTVVNYDLPWNPQRIEQRIGRCHRYGQRRDVTVINFLAADNAAQQLTYEILAQKLDLFGTVLGATDEVLHRPGAASSDALASALGGELESQLGRIYERARTQDEIERELRVLRDTIADRRREFEAAQERTCAAIRSRLDESVRRVFAHIQESLPRELADFDAEVEGVVVAYLDGLGVSHCFDRASEPPMFVVEPSPSLPGALSEGLQCRLGSDGSGSRTTPMHLAHPLVQAALDHIRNATIEHTLSVRITPSSIELACYRGQRGRLALVRVSLLGLETTEQLLPVVVFDGELSPLAIPLARELLAQPIVDVSQLTSTVTDQDLADAIDEAVFEAVAEHGTHEQPRFEQTLQQLDRFLADRVLLLERKRELVSTRFAKAEAARAAAVGADQRSRAEDQLRSAQQELELLELEMEQLRGGDNPTYQRWRSHTEERRYALPKVERLFDAEIEIA